MVHMIRKTCKKVSNLSLEYNRIFVSKKPVLISALREEQKIDCVSNLRRKKVKEFEFGVKIFIVALYLFGH